MKALQLASSEHLVRCVDWGQEVSGGRTYHWIAMPYVEGRTLREELTAADGKFQPARARLIARGVALGLQALHELQIVHRDVKPENIIITSDGVSPTAGHGAGPLPGPYDADATGRARGDAGLRRSPSSCAASPTPPRTCTHSGSSCSSF